MKRLKPWMMNIVTFVVMGLLLMAQRVWAQRDAAPADTLATSQTLISYQGTLTDATGNPIGGTLPMQFSLYDAASDGNLLWGPENQNVEVSDGQFHVLLGSVAPIDPGDLYKVAMLYLDVSVNGESLTPRELLSSVASAINVKRVFLSNPNSEAASVELGWANDVARIRIGGTGVGSTDGLDIQTIGDTSLMRLLGNGNVGIGTSTPAHKLDVAGNASLEDHQLLNVQGLQLKDWDDNTGGEDNKYRVLARDGAWQFYNGGVVVGGYADGTWSDLADGRLIVKSKLAVGTTSPTAETAVQINSVAVPLTLKESDRTGQGSLWRMPLDNGDLRFDISTNGSDFTSYVTPLTLWDNGSIGCGAITESNLQTEEERVAGGSDRFEEGDVLCWAGERLEKCAAANDRLVQAVADKSGRPIVIGAEMVKVIGPVRYGDILVASDVPGYAMVNNDPISGSVIAQALEDFDGEQGIIKAMIRKF